MDLTEREVVCCSRCGAELEEDCAEYYSVNGSDEQLCGECYHDECGACDHCGEYFEWDDLRQVNGGDFYVCSDCLRRFTQCDSCNEYFTDSRIWASDDNGAICRTCRPNYFICEDCEQIFHIDDMEEYGGELLCGECYPNHSQHGGGLIHDYSYKPDVRFLDGCSGYGLELEIDKGNDCEETAESLLAAANDRREHIYIKHDGSLCDGMEIVSHVGSVDYHANSFPWAEISEIAIRNGFRSHDTETCGLHIHASRSLFGNTRTQQDLTIAKVMLIIERYWNEYVVPFSRRAPEKLQAWANKPGANILPSDDEYTVIEKGRNEYEKGRYQAVNLQNYYTVEFRLFRGTLRRNTIIASIQWVDTLIKTAKKTELANIWELSWADIFANTEYTELNEYLTNKNLKGDK